ncbi:MAG: ATP-binding protein [Saprospiraceae bacterium]
MELIRIEDLRKIIALSDLSDEHLNWILQHSEYEEFEDGSVIAKFGDPADIMWFLLEGKVNFYMNINGRQVYYFTFENNTQTGGVGGMMPYSRMKTYPGTSYATGNVQMLRFHKKHFTELEQLNPEFIQKLIGYMTERARAFATMQLQHEKVNALGNLAAGIAHELNNPAAAINTISSELGQRLNRNFELTENLLQCCVKPEQIQNIRAIVDKKSLEPTPVKKLSILKKMEIEDSLDVWLDKNDVPNTREAAETFSEFGFSIEELELVCSKVDKASGVHILQWLENVLSSQKIIKDLGVASKHISDLVGAIKSHVHMDRIGDMQGTDLHKDIENTLTLLGYKIRGKNIVIKKNFNDHLPMVPAYVGELNQVWTNIIDNAIFALQKNGELTIETSFEGNTVKVSIIDNGAGIPKDIMTRIFEPFFTTKKVGEGTGIGLDIVNRAIKHHNGEIKVNSIPGRTEFAVLLPIEQKQY